MSQRTNARAFLKRVIVSCSDTGARVGAAYYNRLSYGNPSQTFETTFDSSPAGLTDISYPEIQMLGRQRSRIVYHSPDLRVMEDANTHQTIFRVASVFGSTESVLIGFGKPNAAVSVYDDAARTWKRLTAFMFFRNKSRISARDELQVGLYFELVGLSLETRQRLLKAMEHRAGVRSSTCAHLTAAALSEAGFSLGGGRDIGRVYRPSHMAALIWRFGLQHEGKTVSIRVVNTSRLGVRDHLVGVWLKEFMSPFRLIAKQLHRRQDRAPRVAVESQPVTVRENSTWDGVLVTVKMSRPSMLGSFLTILWGRHAEIRVSVPGLLTIPELSLPLRPFPGPLMSWASKAKKNFLFSRPVVALINRIRASSFDRYNSIPIDAALEMMSPVQEIEGEVAQIALWNCAIVAVDDTYEFRLSPLKNQDVLSSGSKLRRLSDWILAKHVVATGYDSNTVFAGEAWVIRDGTAGGVTLCVNNNSGTYKPTVDQLESAAQLIRLLGLRVETRVH